MSSAAEPPERISVSREALRAELAELELRLTKYLDNELHEKANKVEVVALATSVQDKANAREFGKMQVHLSDVQKAVTDLADQIRVQDKVNEALRAKSKEIAESTASNFTRREKALAAVMGACALAIQLWSSGAFQ